jgi:polysaccharide biosynthesis protein PslG
VLSITTLLGSALLAGCDTQAAPSSPPPRAIGMSPNLLGESSAAQKTALADMKNNLHLSAIRVDANWDYVQHGGPRSFDWHVYDTLVSNIRAAGLSIDFIINGSATWASASGVDTAAPTNPTQFAAWGAAVAKRYGGGGTTTYEIWNEPNNARFWSTGPNPALYTQDLIAAYKAIKAVRPRQMVISGGLAPEANDGTNINPVTFLQAIYADGGKNYFDAVGYHPYSYPALPSTLETWSGFSQLSATSPSIRSVMAANGDGAKQVWFTEVGWPSNVPSTTGVPGLTAQADALRQVVRFAEANRWVGPVYWYSYQDEGVRTTDVEDNFGLRTSVGAAKPAYAAMAKR